MHPALPEPSEAGRGAFLFKKLIQIYMHILGPESATFEATLVTIT